MDVLQDGSIIFQVSVSCRGQSLSYFPYWKQIKDEEWGGEFVDLIDQEIPQCSHMRVIYQGPEPTCINMPMVAAFKYFILYNINLM